MVNYRLSLHIASSLGSGPFVASIAPMLTDFLKWSVLFCLLFIPYASIFWMVFGPTNQVNAPFLSDIPGLLFTVFSMAAFSNLSTVEDLMSIDKNMARILVGSFVAISTIVILNLLIAMLADTFTRYSSFKGIWQYIFIVAYRQEPLK